MEQHVNSDFVEMDDAYSHGLQHHAAEEES